jgi:uncharacterized protein YpmS
MKLPDLWKKYGFLLLAMLAILFVLVVSVGIGKQL